MTAGSVSRNAHLPGRKTPLRKRLILQPDPNRGPPFWDGSDRAAPEHTHGTPRAASGADPKPGDRPSSALLKSTPGCGFGSGRATIRSNPCQHWAKSPILCRTLFLCWEEPVFETVSGWLRSFPPESGARQACWRVPTACRNGSPNNTVPDRPVADFGDFPPFLPFTGGPPRTDGGQIRHPGHEGPEDRENRTNGASAAPGTSVRTESAPRRRSTA